MAESDAAYLAVGAKATAARKAWVAAQAAGQEARGALPLLAGDALRQCGIVAAAGAATTVLKSKAAALGVTLVGKRATCTRRGCDSRGEGEAEEDVEDEADVTPLEQPLEQVLADTFADAQTRTDLEPLLAGHTLAQMLRSVSLLPVERLRELAHPADGAPDAQVFMANFARAVFHFKSGTSSAPAALDGAGIRRQSIRLREWAEASGDLLYHEDPSRHFPFSVPHQWPRSMNKLQATSDLMGAQLAFEYPDEADSVWAGLDRLGHVTNKKRKLPGHFKEKRVAELASQCSESSLVSPPFNRPLHEFVMALLHLKLNIMNQVFFRLLKAGGAAYSEVMGHTLRQALDDHPLLRRVNLAPTHEERLEEQTEAGHGMHTALMGNDAAALQDRMVDIVQGVFPVANYVALEFKSGALDGYAYVSDPGGSKAWFSEFVKQLKPMIDGWCHNTGRGNTEHYLFQVLRRVHDETTWHDVKAEYMSAQCNTGDALPSYFPLSHFFDAVRVKLSKGGSGQWARGGLGSGWYRCTESSLSERHRMAHDPGLYAQACEYSAIVIGAVLCFNDCYGLLAVKSGALSKGGEVEAVDDEVVADIAKYYGVGDEGSCVESLRGRQLLVHVDIVRVRARQFFETLVSGFAPGNDTGLTDVKVKHLVSNYVHMLAEHADRMMIDVWLHNTIPFGETTEQAAEGYIHSIKQYISSKEERLQGVEPRLQTLKDGTVSHSRSALMQQIKNHCIRHQSNVQPPKKQIFKEFGTKVQGLVVRRPNRDASKYAEVDGVRSALCMLGDEAQAQIAAVKRRKPDQLQEQPTSRWIDISTLKTADVKTGVGLKFLKEVCRTQEQLERALHDEETRAGGARKNVLEVVNRRIRILEVAATAAATGEQRRQERQAIHAATRCNDEQWQERQAIHAATRQVRPTGGVVTLGEIPVQELHGEQPPVFLL